MDRKDFEDCVRYIQTSSFNTILRKTDIYSSEDDVLKNFKVGSDISGLSPMETCWGYMTKHLAALRCKIEDCDLEDMEDFVEKCRDSVNYLCLLYCLAVEEIHNKGDEE